MAGLLVSQGGPVMLHRHAITDEQWALIKGLLPIRGRRAENRLFVDAVLWMAKTGAPWRDLPERFGSWNSVFQRFNRWCKQGVWKRLFDAWKDPDLECLMLDSTVIRAHQHAAGKGGIAKVSVARAEDSVPKSIWRSTR